jgi:DNA-binding response OmpR family regulator
MKSKPRILVFESDEVLRAMIFSILRHQLVDVDTAARAEQALARVSRCDYAIAIVDLDNPEDEVDSFFAHFRDLRPSPPTFVLGLRDPRNDRTFDVEAVSAILHKPLELDTLAEIVRECVGAVPVSGEDQPCPPAESEIRAGLDRGSARTN